MPDHKLLVFTGPIDAYFASQGMPKLEYRSIIFEVRNLAFKGLNGNGDVALIFIHAKPNFGQLRTRITISIFFFANPLNCSNGISPILGAHKY